jgi:hypothetical protein
MQNDFINYANPPAWMNQGNGLSIAFPLLGFAEGYGYENSAEHGLSIITEWFNDTVNGAARRAMIGHVFLFKPDPRPKLRPDLIEDAWRRAWEYARESPPSHVKNS